MSHLSHLHRLGALSVGECSRSNYDTNSEPLGPQANLHHLGPNEEAINVTFYHTSLFFTFCGIVNRLQSHIETTSIHEVTGS